MAKMFVAKVWWSSSGVMSPRSSCVFWKAALLTSTSSLPNAATVSFTSFLQWAGSVMSPGSRSALRPDASTQRAVSRASSSSFR